VLVFVLALLVSAGPAHAAPRWLAPVELAGTAAAQPQVALDAKGNAVAVWDDAGLVRAATRAAGGHWSAVQNLSAAGEDPDSPRVALDAKGNAVVVWEQSTTGKRFVQAATRPAGGGSVKDGWSAAQDVSPAGQNDYYNPDVAIDGMGNAVAVWYGYDRTSSNYVIQAATRPAGGGSVKDGWSAPRDLSTAEGYAFNPRVATNAKGDAVAVWSRYNSTDTNTANLIVAAATRPVGGGSVNDGWSTPQDLSAAGRDAQAARVALDAQGNAGVVWEHAIYKPYVTPASTVQAATRPAEGGSVKDGWSAPQDISAAGQVASGPQVAFDEKGNATAVWKSGAPLSGNLQAATRPAGGGSVKDGWSAPQDVSPSLLNVDSYQLAVNPDGKAIVVWTRFEGNVGLPLIEDSTKFTVVAATRPPAGSWSQPQDLSDSYTVQPLPAAAMDPQGNAVALWAASDPTNTGKSIIKARGYDAAGPQLRDLAVPQAGTASTPLAFAVSPLDVWSDVASTSWSFGDGTSAPAKNASHRYAAPGSYEVTVTSTDSLGNATVEKRTVRVASAPGDGDGGGGGGDRPSGGETTSGTDGPQGHGPAPGAGAPGGAAPGGAAPGGAAPAGGSPSGGGAGGEAPGAGGGAGAVLHPAKLEVARSRVLRADRRLDVLAPITGRASGEVKVEFHAAQRRYKFTDKVDAQNRRMRFNKRIPAKQADLGTGILTITYPGVEDTRPQEVRLRAASQKAKLELERPRIEDGRIKAQGTISKRARGVVRLQVQYVVGGQTETVKLRGRIDEGRWKIDEALSQEVREGIARRSGPVHSYTLFTGYYPRRIRGEMQSYQVAFGPAPDAPAGRG
jgi:hypothetical protein